VYENARDVLLTPLVLNQVELSALTIVAYIQRFSRWYKIIKLSWL
jgi:hypothetical protein